MDIKDVRSFYLCKVGDIEDFEIMETYEKICTNGFLKDENIIDVEKGLTYALGFPTVFKVELIKLILSRIYYMKMWLEDKPIKINKATIH